jgi:thiol:disulfide interchange protein
MMMIVGALLGGSASFVGQLLDIQVVVMMLATQPKSLAQSRHALPSPLHRERVRGPMVCIRMDDNAEPQDFTYEQYAAYCKSKGVAVPPLSAATSTTTETKASAAATSSSSSTSTTSTTTTSSDAARRKKKNAKKKAAKKAKKVAAAAAGAPAKK